MKSTGVVRKVDELGRIVLPRELRNTLDIEAKTPIEIFVDGEKIVLQKYQPDGICMVTGEVSERNFVLANGKIIVSSEGADYLMKELQQYLVK
ncbi:MULTISPECIES: AbrB/MazE/SpoVT family DNA-binding domain-containing protein [Bacillus cereus group]|uniref:AbrB/MazE/SpoVT family DNA-binding domain-containing protein n=1 Tax=Bacillus cereus TaxID=1396 RepID=A0A9X6X547_BACCE|nr:MULTISPECIES: AbrB/MazE/SpoVT family DNA-binding domain-containing protein [Bacillus cereus group]ANN35875.1 AbrB family transcriptional regulator [Bacillus thuringiensis serovar coreanensis]MED3468838.1 AbrB/MazE/SpoVT family DNA-binding domain-containing protein [Bacillus thuringiensis]EJR92723.1 AbrB family transcriptional regulator [Bacillus mycoides]MCQ6341535.1 AbrB/MazE/SpoVT family DNA-binding domain-containing protein [Bacillus cereus]OUA90144.1 AbrB family transcriptional regulato